MLVSKNQIDYFINQIKISIIDSELYNLKNEFKKILIISAVFIPISITFVYEFNRLADSLWHYEKSATDKSHLMTPKEFNDKYNQYSKKAQ